MQEVHQERLQHVLPVVAEHDRLAAFLPRDAVEVPAPEPRAERAIGPPFGNGPLDDRIGVAPLDPVRDAVAREEVRQDLRRKARLRLVEVAGEKLYRKQPAPFEVEQQRQQRVGVLSAREADQPLRSRPHHAVSRERLAHLPDQPLPELAELDGRGRVAEERMAGLRRDLVFPLRGLQKHQATPAPAAASVITVISGGTPKRTGAMEQPSPAETMRSRPSSRMWP